MIMIMINDVKRSNHSHHLLPEEEKRVWI